MYSPMDIDEQDYYLKPMNCPFHIHDLQVPACAPTATCPCAGPSSARSTATSAAARCTACCACAASPRTTPTSSARPSRSTTRSCGCSTSRLASCADFGFTDIQDRAVGARPEEPREVRRQRRHVAPGRGLPRQGPGDPRATLRADGGRGRLLRSQDRHQDQGRHRPAAGSARPSSSTSTCRSAST